MATPDRTRGATPLGGASRGGGGGGIPKWLLPLLLLLAIIALVLFLVLGGDDEDEGTAATGTQATATAPPADTPPPAETREPGATGGGALTASGTALLPVPAEGLSEFVGQTATGMDVEVLEATADKGFAVGTSATDRVYVEYGGSVGEEETGSYAPKVGDKVQLTGEVRPAPRNPAKALNVSPETAKLITEQGGFINADSVKAAG